MALSLRIFILAEPSDRYETLAELTLDYDRQKPPAPEKNRGSVQARFCRGPGPPPLILLPVCVQKAILGSRRLKPAPAQTRRLCRHLNADCSMTRNLRVS